MDFVTFVVFLLGIALALDCGEYTTDCRVAGPIFVQHAFVVSTDKQGHAKQIQMEESQYTEDGCRGTPYLVFDTDLRLKIRSSASSSYDYYDMTYKSVKMTVKDTNTFASLGFACKKRVRQGSSFSLSSNECTQAGLPYTRVYTDSIGTTIQGVRIQSSDKRIQFLGLTAKQSGIAGCTGTIVTIVVICVVAVIVLLAALILCYCKRK
ncbi:hypothetical protein AV274_1061 [Blastocystis sp. ATCC 50177/Nand II]|uniref:Uncharacterized protein n=1 Tax=Blastocystis sp. subtype 1 (strain ATCC 50177 / NandII) TaxID=478820 RepID=A0A196SLW5_BLAHN|nr:hypothetical protein AV274_1061 [Blastocystis sp. ATCC 50177/Nand II]